MLIKGEHWLGDGQEAVQAQAGSELHHLCIYIRNSSMTETLEELPKATGGSSEGR